jgi:hypothetical protein
VKTIEKNQDANGESYPWASSVDLKAEKWIETLFQSPGKAFQSTHMDNLLKEFEELLLDNTLLKVQNQALVDKNPN